MPWTARRCWWACGVAGFAALLLVAAHATTALAHGGGAPQFTAAPAGPYRLFAWTSPEPWRVGAAHTSVAVTLPTADGRDTPVSGAQITVIYTPVDGASPPLRMTAVEGSGAQLGFYEADAILPAAGAWAVTILVAGDAGSGEAGFTLSVLPAESGVNWGLVAVGAVALTLIAAVGVAAWLSNRRRTAAGVQQSTGSL